MSSSLAVEVSSLGGVGSNGGVPPYHRPGMDHGRAPTLTMRHTIHDKLAVATQAAFLPFRAVLHRNGDEMVLLSEEVTEQRLASAASVEASVSRSLIVTTTRLYLMRMPSRTLFAPCSVGACFALSELSRLCVAQSTGVHVTLQFMNGVVAIQCQSQRETQAIVDVIFGATGIAAESLAPEEEDAARIGSTHFARPMRRVAVSTISNAASVDSTSSSSRRPPDVSQHVEAMSVTQIGGAEGALRKLLQQQQPQRGASSQQAALLPGPFEDRGMQTETLLGVDRSTTCHSWDVPGWLVERSTSPTRFVTPSSSAPAVAAPSGHTTGHSPSAIRTHSQSVAARPQSPRASGRGGSNRNIFPTAASALNIAATQELESDRGSSTATSDFEPMDVWRSLNSASAGPRSKHATPPPAAAPASAAGRVGAKTGVVDERDTRGPSSRRSPTATVRHATTPLSTSADPVPSSTAPPPMIERDTLPPSSALLQSDTPPSSAAAATTGQRAVAELNSFLGVLSGYATTLRSRGIDSASALLALSDSDIDRLLDDIGVTKQGHRMLMHSKVALGRQQQKA